MSDFFLGEIQVFGFGFAPKNWALCAGQLMSIQQNTALFALLGTTFGGDGIRTFALPDLRGRLPVGQGAGLGLTPRVLGQTFGEENHTLIGAENPPHIHGVNTIPAPDLTKNTQVPGPTAMLSKTAFTGTVGATTNVYLPNAGSPTAMAAGAVGATGGQPHPNIMPVLCVNFCIALNGIFPSRN
jgi:microcystin-dependent protein